MVRYRIGVLFLLLTAACGSIKTAILTATALPTKPTNPTAVARVYNIGINWSYNIRSTPSQIRITAIWAGSGAAS